MVGGFVLNLRRLAEATREWGFWSALPGIPELSYSARDERRLALSLARWRMLAATPKDIPAELFPGPAAIDIKALDQVI